MTNTTKEERVRDRFTIPQGSEYVEMTDFKTNYDLEFVENIEKPLGRKITSDEYDDIKEQWWCFLECELEKNMNEWQHELIDRWLEEQIYHSGVRNEE